MNYQKIYNDLVEKAKPRGLKKKVLNGYFEKHHILPVCLGGTDEPSNFVMFTAKEHFIAHMLLWKAYPEDLSLASAAFFMRNTRDERNKFTSKLYSKLSEDYSKVMSIRMSKENSPHYKDLTGQTNFKLTITGFSHWQERVSGESQSMWHADCSCGNSVVIHGSSFTIGNTRSCGCLRAENIRKYPFSKKVRKTYYPLERKYLATGELCERWSDADRGIYNFAEDMGEPESEDLAIGRIDNKLPYSKENCAWMTMREVTLRGKKHSRNKSGRTGVRILKGSYQVEIGVNGKTLYIGRTDSFEEAVKMRGEAELKYYGFIKE